MKIKELRLQNFKRFTDLTITDIPEDCRLVLLIGANGSGKSSVFDIFSHIENKRWIPGYGFKEYHQKNLQPVGCNINLWNSPFAITFKNDELTSKQSEILNKNFFYGRPSLRIIPKIKAAGYSKEKIEENKDAVVEFIEAEDRFINDIYDYVNDFNEAVRKVIFTGQNPDYDKLRSEYIEPINQSLRNIFGTNPNTSIQLINFIDANAARPPQLVFRKGNSDIVYDYLSHGEKQVIVILFNLLVRRKYFTDTVYYVDEMDIHLETSIQYKLLKEITEYWLPANCQLWTASHSLGFIDYAKDYTGASIIDFDNLDFDIAQTLVPAKKDITIYDISIPKELLDRLYDQGKRIVICENKNDELLNKAGFDNYYFAGVADSASVFARSKNNERITGLRDRDYFTKNECNALQKKYTNYKITGLYCFENYLYHPDNIEELAISDYNKEDYLNDILKQKKIAQSTIIPNLTSSRKNYEEFKLAAIPRDKDLKEIMDALLSDIFEDYYPFFSMKDYYQKNYLSQFNIKKEDLIKTHWFKTRFEKILS